MNAIKLPYGLRGNNLVHIAKVESGLACGCNCPHCLAPLVAKKGKKGKNNAHHFSHHKTEPCAHAVETALHLAAKDILDKERVIKLPEVTLDIRSNYGKRVLTPASHYPIEVIRIEQREAGLVPDLIATIEGNDVWIEIYVTHRVDDAKLDRIRNHGVSAIEIDLSKAPRDLTSDDLADVVIHDITNKTWLHNVDADRKYRELLAECRDMPVVERRYALHVDYCPIQMRVWKGKPYANVIDDCWDCKHCIDVADDNRTIRCNGHVRTG